MYCTNCGKMVEETWARCPYCGEVFVKKEPSQMTGPIGQNHSERNLQQSGQSERGQKTSAVSLMKPVIVTIIIAVILAAAIFAIVMASVVIEQDSVNQDALEFAQTWAYDEYEGITLKEVLEYTWSNGVWDSFVTEEDEQYVEYASDETEDICIQFAVDLTKKSVEPRYLERDGIPATNISEVDSALQEMYNQYIINEKSLRNIDVADYVGGDVLNLLLEASGSFIINSDGTTYRDVTGYISISCMDGMIDMVDIEGDKDYAPGFAGISIGESLQNSSDSGLIDAGYTFYASDYIGIVYLYEDGKSGVLLGSDENQDITFIKWMSNMGEYVASAGVSKQEPESGYADEDALEAGQKDVGITDVLDAYQKYIENELMISDFAGYDFIYLDEDDIPELVVFGNSEASGNLIFSYYDGIVNMTQLSHLSFSYIEKGNLLCNSEGNMGRYYDIVYSIMDGMMQVIAEGDYNYKDDIYQEDENGEPLYDYYWNGNKVDAETYLLSLEEIYPSANAVNASSQNCFNMNVDIHAAFESSDAKSADTSYILPDSNSRYLTMSELRGFTKEECRIARNEIYARYGRLFVDEELQAYFDSCDWYTGWIEADDFDDSVLNEYEIANRDLIMEYEETMGY